MSNKPDISVSQRVLYSLRLDIINKKYKAGDQFPTVRSLAFDMSINPNTMQKVLSLLEDEGLLVSKGTVGRFVTDDASAIENARHELQREYMENAVKAAGELGISKEQFIKYVTESEEMI